MGEAGDQGQEQAAVNLATKELIGPTRSLADVALHRVKAGSFYGPQAATAEQRIDLRADDAHRVISSPVDGLSVFGFEIDTSGQPVKRLKSINLPSDSLEWGAGHRYAEGLNYSDEKLGEYLTDKYPNLTPKELSMMALHLQEGSSRISDINYSALNEEWIRKSNT